MRQTYSERWLSSAGSQWCGGTANGAYNAPTDLSAGGPFRTQSAYSMQGCIGGQAAAPWPTSHTPDLYPKQSPEARSYEPILHTQISLGSTIQKNMVPSNAKNTAGASISNFPTCLWHIKFLLTARGVTSILPNTSHSLSLLSSPENQSVTAPRGGGSVTLECTGKTTRNVKKKANEFSGVFAAGSLKCFFCRLPPPGERSLGQKSVSQSL